MQIDVIDVSHRILQTQTTEPNRNEAALGNKPTPPRAKVHSNSVWRNPFRLKGSFNCVACGGFGCIRHVLARSANACKCKHTREYAVRDVRTMQHRCSVVGAMLRVRQNKSLGKHRRSRPQKKIYERHYALKGALCCTRHSPHLTNSHMPITGKTRDANRSVYVQDKICALCHWVKTLTNTNDTNKKKCGKNQLHSVPAYTRTQKISR